MRKSWLKNNNNNHNNEKRFMKYFMAISSLQSSTEEVSFERLPPKGFNAQTVVLKSYNSHYFTCLKKNPVFQFTV